MTRTEDITADELLLHLDNTEHLHRQERHVYGQLIKRKLKGAYDLEQAPKAFKHVVESAAQDYVREYDARGSEWHRVFSPADRRTLERYLVKRFEGKYKIGELDDVVEELAPVAYRRAQWKGNRLRSLSDARHGLPKTLPTAAHEKSAKKRRKEGPFSTMAEVRSANKGAGLHWFERDTLRFFNTKIETGLIDGRYFISSEQDKDRLNPAWKGKRLYTIREALRGGDIETVGEFGGHHTLREAKATLDRMIHGHANGRRNGRRKPVPKGLGRTRPKGTTSQKGVLAAALRKDRRTRR